MGQFIEHHYAACLIGACVAGLVIGVAICWWLGRRAAAGAIGRGLNW